MNLKETFKQAVALYTEQTVTDVDFVPDTTIRGTYAIRATMRGHSEDTIDFVIHDPSNDPYEISLGLEEVTFNTWPPVSRML